MLNHYEQWLQTQLQAELSAVSAAEHTAFLQPIEDLQRQCQRILQTFRCQLAERVSQLFGVNLHTPEAKIEVQRPQAPDVNVGRMFEHNWELISALIPMFLVRNLVRRRFFEKVESEVFRNLSRLTSLWEETINHAIRCVEKESLQRLQELGNRSTPSAESFKRSDSIQDYLAKLRSETECLESSPQPMDLR